MSAFARRSLEEAARNLMTNHSISVVVASGNSQENSCMIAPGTFLPLGRVSKIETET